MWDALVIGGGFYGTAIATYLSVQRGFKQVVLVERESELLTRASATTQARVHNGYHYPRSFVSRDFSMLYAIARRNSNVTARHFERFCEQIGASLKPVPAELRSTFDPRLIEQSYLAEEYAFDVTKLRKRARADLVAAGVKVELDCRVTALRASGEELVATLRLKDGRDESLSTRSVFNCTYSGLNQFVGAYTGSKTKLKHEITEMALMKVAPAFKKTGVTVMDGAFFSMMPFPSRGLHSLSHVRYTPHESWIDEAGSDPYQRLQAATRVSRVDRMTRDVARYMPGVVESSYVESIFEVKTVLVKNEGDEGRPILFERHAELPHVYSVLGGKIDNIYDVLARLDAEPLLSTERFVSGVRRTQ
jgi:glycine/D-amino acid oxidase-like deaminating enzyme